MPELTLADVERVQGLLDELTLVMLRAAGATSPTVRRNAERIMVNYHKAIGGLVAERPALLALAREALERRERVADEGAKLRELMQDPRYWHDRDPEIVARVTAGWRKLYPESPDA